MRCESTRLCGVKMVYNDLENMLNEDNWDNGFEIPKEILADPRCDLALALEIFYLSDGYAYLEDLEKTTDLKGKFHLCNPLFGSCSIQMQRPQVPQIY